MVMAYTISAVWGRTVPMKQRPQTPPLKKGISRPPTPLIKAGTHEE